ncbi:hypothetical protein C7S14_4044 [Burkholderia cepacia]|nr:hypothetical protein C7S14_4044 [Burkholderia cepacia]
MPVDRRLPESHAIPVLSEPREALPLRGLLLSGESSCDSVSGDACMCASSAWQVI